YSELVCSAAPVILRYQFEQSGSVDWLSEIIRATDLQALLPYTLHGVGGEGHDGAFKAFPLQLRSRLITIQYWHLKVHQDEIIVTTFGFLDPLVPVAGDLD